MIDDLADLRRILSDQAQELRKLAALTENQAQLIEDQARMIEIRDGIIKGAMNGLA